MLQAGLQAQAHLPMPMLNASECVHYIRQRSRHGHVGQLRATRGREAVRGKGNAVSPPLLVREPILRPGSNRQRLIILLCCLTSPQASCACTASAWGKEQVQAQYSEQQRVGQAVAMCIS